MSETKVFDWRVWKAGTVARDSTLPDGKPIKEGDVFYVTTRTRDSRGVLVSFVTPSPISLALNVSIGAALEGARLRKVLPQTEWFDLGEVPALYDYFEHCMIAAIFAFQSLEAFANQVVSEGQKGALRVMRKGEPKEWSPEEVERNCSTEEKFCDILPRIGSFPSPKGKKPWEGFKRLKGLRDSTIHMKSPDQYVRDKEDKTSLYHRFLTHNPKEFPRWAIALIRHFTAKGADAWLKAAETRLDTT